MEPLQRLTRRQLIVLQLVERLTGDDRTVSLTTLAEALGIRAPSALEHLRSLERLRLVRRERGKSRLTPAGSRCLSEYQRHHRVAERLFSEVNLPAEAACRAAREIDLALSHRTVNRLWTAQGEPATCPHGEPIRPPRSPPGRGG